MFGWWNRLRRDRRGVAAVEFGLLLPILMVLLVGIAELGRYLGQAEAVEKGLRAGAMYAARQSLPLSGTAKTEIENLVKTGTRDGSGIYLAAGWNESGAKVDITATNNSTTDGTAVTVIELTANVPYDELLPGMLGFFGILPLNISMSHEQVHIGA